MPSLKTVVCNRKIYYSFVTFVFIQNILTSPSLDCPISCKCKPGSFGSCKSSSSGCGKPLNSLGYCTYFCSRSGFCGFGDNYQSPGSIDCFGCQSNNTCDNQYIASSRSISGYDACRIEPNSMPWLVRLAFKSNPNNILKQSSC